MESATAAPILRRYCLDTAPKLAPKAVALRAQGRSRLRPRLRAYDGGSQSALVQIEPAGLQSLESVIKFIEDPEDLPMVLETAVLIAGATDPET